MAEVADDVGEIEDHIVVQRQVLQSFKICNQLQIAAKELLGR